MPGTGALEFMARRILQVSSWRLNTKNPGLLDPREWHGALDELREREVHRLATGEDGALKIWSQECEAHEAPSIWRWGRLIKDGQAG